MRVPMTFRMSITRRATRLVAMALAATGLAWSATADAQAWPSRPVKLIAPYPAGGPTDAMARLLAAEMSKTLGQPVVVENRAGGAGSVGTDVVAKSPADGYTVCFCTTGPTILMPLMQPRLGYKPDRDLLPVGLVHRVELSFLLGPKIAAANVKELIAFAKANPGKLSYASPGTGSPNHMGGELLKTLAGLDILHVPYKGEGPAMVDLIGGQIEMMVGSVFVGDPHVKAGKLRMIAVTGPTRAPGHPDTPTVAETLPGFEATSHVGLHVPAGTPGEAIDKLNAAMRAAIAQPAVRERMIREGITPLGTSAAEYADYLKRETTKWAKIVKDNNITLD